MKEQEFMWIEPREIVEDVNKCKGKHFNETFDKLKTIISFQFKNQEIKGIKGFIFHGEVGTGKTLLARVLSRSLNIPILFVDGSTIARHLYGESEEQINEVFQEASRKKGIILIDDAESVFPDREWLKGESWHVAQNNILFHCLDNMNTSKTIVIMTTNKYNLLDRALKDRLYPIEFGEIDKDTMLEIAQEKCLEKNLKFEEIKAEIEKNPEKYVSVRALEKMMEEKYINKLMGGND